MKLRWFAILLLGASLHAWAGDIKNVEAEVEYIVPSSMSIDEAKLHAVERAKIEAIANEFGTKIAQANTSYISNEDGRTKTNFSNLGLSEVNGEWLETTKGPKFAKIDILEDGSMKVRCRIEGRARRIGYKADFQSAFLRNVPSLRHKSNEFIHGDELFLYFKAPQNGYVNVFLMDSNSDAVYCLLPNKESTEGAIAVERDKEYVFFNDESFSYVVTASQPEEFNDLVIIFSPTRFDKAYIDNLGDTYEAQSLSTANFNKWLTKIRVKDPSLTVHFETIKIKRES